jgi:hypothetical protein
VRPAQHGTRYRTFKAHGQKRPPVVMFRFAAMASREEQQQKAYDGEEEY